MPKDKEENTNQNNSEVSLTKRQVIRQIKHQDKNLENGMMYWFFNTSVFKTIIVILLNIVFIATALDTLLGLFTSVYAIITLDVSLLSDNLLLLFAWTLAPLFFWIISTASEWFTYKRRRTVAFIIVTIHGAEVILKYVLRAVMFVVTSLLLYIPVNGHVSSGIVVYLGYYIIGLIYVLMSVFFYKLILSNIADELTTEKINAFYLTDFFGDFYVRKKYSYTLEFIRYLDTGKKYVISMKDRFLHMLGIGATGTGKTSSCVSVSLAHDFDIKAQNIDIQKKIVQKWLEAGNVRIKQTFADKDFNLCFFEGTGKYARQYNKKLTKLAKRIPNAGMTIMCPNSAFADEVYNIAKRKGFGVNRIDPSFTPSGGLKEDCVGMNPLYVDPELLNIDQEQYFEAVIQTAELFAEVNQAIFDQSARSDPYFAGVNTNMAVNAAVIMIIAVPLRDGRFATIPDVLRVLSNFQFISPYRETIIERFGAPGMNGRKETALGRTNVGDALQQYVDGIDVDFLGANAADMNRQCTGLRNIIKSSIALPRIKKLLTAPNIINFDEILSRGEITIVNFDLSLGHDVSTSFGLFFMLNFINAVLRRGRGTRIPHFFFIDEAHVLLHPRMEFCATLFRQYKVGCMFFLQSLGQIDKSESTKYLKNVFVGNMSHQLLFGRASLEEMRYYSEVGGLKKKVETEESTRESALSVSDPTLQTSTSNSVVDDDIVSETDIRYRRFLECHVYSVRRGMPLKPFVGKVNFLNEKNGGYIDRYTVEWEKYSDVNTLHPDIYNDVDFTKVMKKTSTTNIGNSSDNTPVEDETRRPVIQSSVDLFNDNVVTAEPDDCVLSSSDAEPTVPTDQNNEETGINPAEDDQEGNAYTEVY
jgi:hypothetical protein